MLKPAKSEEKLRIETDLFNYFVQELSNKRGAQFENFVNDLLTSKYGKSKWTPKDGCPDGKIDFATENYLIQIYGATTKYGSVKVIANKRSEVKVMRQTAKNWNLTATEVIFLTNIFPNPEMDNQIRLAEKEKVTIKSIFETASFLFNVFFPFDDLNYYHRKRCKMFEKEENWPYHIDEKTFVKNFDFKSGVLNKEQQLNTEQDCISFICKNIVNVPVFCVAEYGMGKTAISKILFKIWDSSRLHIYPVYFSLTHEDLKFFTYDELQRKVVDEVKVAFKNNVSHKNVSIEKFDEEMFIKNIGRMIKNRKILLVFDGLDEANWENNDLQNFLQYIIRNGFLFFLTCRLEYQPFFDQCKVISIEKKPHKCVELCKWGERQWTMYVAGLSSKFSSKKELVNSFYQSIILGIYSNLPERPLFLKMLSDLEIDNKTDIVIAPELKKNLAEVYYKFIKWKITDDYIRKSGGHPKDSALFLDECFKFLQEVALLEYKSTRNSNLTPATLDSINNICLNKKFVILTEKYVRSILLESSLFAILRRINKTTFTFSHKSFMEYLFAYDLANCIFPEDGNIDSAECGDSWNQFQTHEISQHFFNEIIRIEKTFPLNLEQRNTFIVSALGKVINSQLKIDPMKYDEKTQEALYYIGKLEIRSKNLIHILKNIVDNRNRFDPVYYRSASIALSRILGSKFCEDYVFHLIDDMDNSKIHFNKNLEIQKEYYGITNLLQILKADIDTYISLKNTSSIISLKIFTYFTSTTLTNSNLVILKKQLDQIRNVAIKQGDSNIQKICDALFDKLVI